MITSRDNPRVKWMRSLLDSKGRRQERCYLLEGVILVDDALSAGLGPRLVLYDPDALRATRRGRALLDRLADAPSEEVSAAVLQSMSDTVATQGVIAAYAIPEQPPAFADEGLVVVLDAVRDPGNVGAILRSAQAAGCAAAVTTTGSADLYSPKVVRAAMGAHARLPLFADMAWPRLSMLLAARRVYIAQANGGTPYYEIDWTAPAALVIGNETEGLRPEAQRRATGRVSIPMPGRAESLNASVAASIIIFESVRQRLSGRNNGLDIKEHGHACPQADS